MIELVAKAERRAQLRQFRGQICEQARNVGLAERRWRGADQHGRRAEPLDLQPQFAKFAGSGLEPIAVGLFELHHVRNQQGLARNRPAMRGLSHSLEHQPLGTMGPLCLIDELPRHFLVMNGDVLTDLDFAQLFDDHVRSGALFTISSSRREEIIDYGVLDTDDSGRLTGFREKPRSRYEVSMGIYMLDARVIEYIPRDRLYGFDHLMLDLLAAGEPVAVRLFDGYWLDIGRADDYARAIDEFDAMRGRFLHA